MIVSMSKEEYLKSLSDCVFEMEDEKVVTVAEEYLRDGHSALDGINLGLVDGMNRAGALYEQEEYFVTDLLLCSDAMYNGLDVLKPHLQSETAEGEEPIPAVIGVVQGDTHDIGKNLGFKPFPFDSLRFGAFNDRFKEQEIQRSGDN